MKNIIFIILRSIFSIYSYQFKNFLTKELNFIYSCWIHNEFQQVGSNTRFKRPVYTRGGKNIQIGDNCLFYRSCEINAWDTYKGYKYNPSIEIGDNCQFGPYNHITCCNSVKIGKGVLTGMYVLISDNNHGTLSLEDIDTMPKYRRLTSKGPIIIEDNVWIGDRVAILGGVHIGYGAIVATNSVVTHDVPEKVIVAGNPARVIKKLV